MAREDEHLEGGVIEEVVDPTFALLKEPIVGTEVVMYEEGKALGPFLLNHCLHQKRCLTFSVGSMISHTCPVIRDAQYAYLAVGPMTTTDCLMMHRGQSPLWLVTMRSQRTWATTTP